MGSNEKKKVLFVDDEADDWIGRFNAYLDEYGLEFIAELQADRALDRIGEVRPDVVLLDIMFPDSKGRLEPKGGAVLADIRKHYPSLPVVMLTATLADAAYGIDEEDFVSARFLFAKDRFMDASGCDPYEELAHQLLGAIEESQDNRSLDERLGFVVGKTEKMQAVAETIFQVAATSSTVLLYGESGTGKELAAHAIHQLSPRSEGSFVAVNCGGLTDEVLESQLFGHERGAFTGAVQEHRGFFEQADGGTLFLDEVDAMPPVLQDKLLRVIQDRRIRRMGSQQVRKVDVRLIAATNKCMPDMVAEGRFRQDLYYRLRVVELELPPLRERLADVPVLYQALVEKLNDRLGKSIASELREDVLEKLRSYLWPGNIRELEHVLERAMVTAKANVLTPSAIKIEENDKEIATGIDEPASIMATGILEGRIGWQTLKDVQGEMRRRVLEELVSMVRQSQGRPPSSSQLAKMLDISEGNMRRILSEAGVRLRRQATRS